MVLILHMGLSHCNFRTRLRDLYSMSINPCSSTFSNLQLFCESVFILGSWLTRGACLPNGFIHLFILKCFSVHHGWKELLILLLQYYCHLNNSEHCPLTWPLFMFMNHTSKILFFFLPHKKIPEDQQFLQTNNQHGQTRWEKQFLFVKACLWSYTVKWSVICRTDFQGKRQHFQDS